MWRFIKSCLEIIRSAPARRRATDAELTERRYSQTNTRELLLRDSYCEAVQEADLQWRNEPELGLMKLLALAELGSVSSMSLVGWAYQAGKGTSVDAVKAEYWFRRALAGGSQHAQLCLGWIYTQRLDYSRCEEVYRVGVAEGWAPAMFYLARIMLRQSLTRARLVEARALLRQASALGDLGAEAMLAAYSARGRFGWRYVPQGFWQLGIASRKLVILDDGIVSADRSKVAALMTVNE